MKKKVVKNVLLALFVCLVVFAISNIYKWIVSGEQYIKISTANEAYSNSDLYVSVVAEKNGIDLDTKTKIKLLDSKKRKVKKAKISYSENNAVISIPEVETGNYYIEAKVSSKAGKDKIQKEIHISNGNLENTTITMDKGIYKPGDNVNFRALLTSKDNNEPMVKEATVCIYDGNDNKVYNENVKTSDFGIISGNFKLADEVNSGIYKLVVKTDSSETTESFKVNPYITPKYEVKIKPDKENYIVGETANISITSNYFFGEPVSNAKYKVFMDNNEYKEITADASGNANVEYKIDQAKSYNIKVEAVDSSNYYVEESSSFVAGTDIFEVSLLSEYGALAAGKKNDIYVLTSTAEGKPVKSYVTINSGKTTKQVATDDNGIGKFSIDVDNTIDTYIDTNSYKKSNNKSTNSSTQEFTVSAENMNGEKVQKNISLNIENRNLLLTTDKAKYNQGEDIKLNISSLNETTKNIYFLKNNKLINMISTPTTETSVNLDDNYGLIDIYITENNKSNTISTTNFLDSYMTKYSDSYNTNSYITNTFKKTIFIKPSKALNIDIQTDKQEYKPGDEMKISFGTTDESNNKVDSALLVSMLDQSILKLADNDLSIDNIKLALQDINFSNELDAATLYTSILDDSSEQTVMALLLKQGNRDIKVSETKMYNYEEETKAQASAIISIIAIIIIVVIYFGVKYNSFREFVKHILNLIIYLGTLLIFSQIIIDECFYRINFSGLAVGIIALIGLATYILWISKIKKRISRTSISIVISTLIILLSTLLIEVFDISAKSFLVILSVIVCLLAIIVRLREIGKLKFLKIIDLKEIGYIFKFLGALALSAVIAFVLQNIISIEGLFVPIGVVLTYLFNCLFNELGKEEKIENNYEKHNSIASYIVVTLAVIGCISIVFGFLHMVSTVENGAVSNNSGISQNSSGRSRNSSGGIDPTTIAPTYGDSSSTKSSKGFSSILDDIESSFENGKSSSNKSAVEENIDYAVDDEASYEEGNIKNDSAQANENEHVRNVFLESMCFVPELITKEGEANLDLKLSDNITTWTIQTVGNTKNGRVGYTSLDTVKVFKDFFVDFETPKNLTQSDKVSIPVTVYNYTENPINTNLKIEENDWFELQTDNNISVSVEAKGSKMVYVPINIINNGNNKFRIEAKNDNLTDIIEKNVNVNPNGYKVEKVVSSGTLDGKVSEDVLLLDDVIENTATAKVKIYSSAMSQTVEGMENIFRMPTGCFEQISSSLYPNILALKYIEDNKIANEEIKTKAKSYISSGYQKLLTYEVAGEKGGYSLYGHSPAETVLTAYGLMEITDLKKVYSIDENVIKNMNEFLYNKQNSNGTFNITGSHVGGAGSSETLALNAYITWALSESNPKEEKISKSIDYLKSKVDDVDDNYTLALIANALVNVGDKSANTVISRLVNNINVDGNNAYLTSNVKDYYGTRSNNQTTQTVALTSMALSKTSKNLDMNKKLINYLISQKDVYGTWYSTQATILSLKALNELNEKQRLENQLIKIKLNSDEQTIEIKDNPLELYEVKFDKIRKENKLDIDIQKGSAYYEIIEEYYMPYDKVDKSKDNIEIIVETNNNLKVNDILQSKVKLINRNSEAIDNGMVTIAIPQGFTVLEDSLMMLQDKGIIEKYETSYNYVNIYLREFEASKIVDLDINFRALYPVDITGYSVRAYDYYNPEIEGKAMPIKIVVNN